MEEKKNYRGGKERPVPSQTTFDRHLFMIFLFSEIWYFITTNYLKGCCRDRNERLKNLLVSQQSGWRLVTAHDISPALPDSCCFHGLQNSSGQTVSPFPSHAVGTILSLSFEFLSETWGILQRKNEYSCIKALHSEIHTCLCLQDQALGLCTTVPPALENALQSWMSKLCCWHESAGSSETAAPKPDSSDPANQLLSRE